MRFESKVTIESTTCEGVRFTIRRLSQMARAKRDMEILEPQLRHAEIMVRMDEIAAPYKGQPVSEMPEELRSEYARLNRESGILIAAHIKPATVKAALVSVEGYELDGKSVSAAVLLENGPDALVDEVFEAIVAHSILTPEQQKNSSSPTTSDAQAGGSASNMTATPVESAVTTGSATAVSTSLAT